MPRVVDRLIRDHVRYTGDGLPGEPVNAPLPIGDPASGVYHPTKRDIRDAIGDVEGDRIAAEAASALAQMAMVDAQGATLQAASLTALLANSAPSYPVGTIFATRAEGYSYEVVANGGDVTTAGGVHLRQIGAGLKRVGPYMMSPYADGGYFHVDYSTARTNMHAYGYTANVKRTGGNQLAVAAQLNAYSRDPAGSSPTFVFGAAIEAWSGDAENKGLANVGLIGIEPAIISQYHANTQALRGADIVFKNRRDGGSLLHGSVGSNGFNRHSRAINISSQLRSPLGEFCGWARGIYFQEGALDASVDGLAVGIDFSALSEHYDRMSHAILLRDGMNIGLSAGAPLDVSMRYLHSAGRIQFRAGGSSPVELLVSGGTPGVAVNGVRVIQAQGPAIPNAGSANQIETINAILDRLRNHGLIAT